MSVPGQRGDDRGADWRPIANRRAPRLFAGMTPEERADIATKLLIGEDDVRYRFNMRQASCTCNHSAEFAAIRGRLDQLFNLLTQEQQTMILDLSKLTASVAAEETVEQSVTKLLGGLTTQLGVVSKELADAQAANDPNAIAAAQSQIDALQAQIDKDTAVLAAAVVANTPAAAVPVGGAPTS